MIIRHTHTHAAYVCSSGLMYLRPTSFWYVRLSTTLFNGAVSFELLENNWSNLANVPPGGLSTIRQKLLKDLARELSSPDSWPGIFSLNILLLFCSLRAFQNGKIGINLRPLFNRVHSKCHHLRSPQFLSYRCSDIRFSLLQVGLGKSPATSNPTLYSLIREHLLAKAWISPQWEGPTYNKQQLII